MIGIIFQYGSDKVEVRIEDVTCYFRTSQSHAFATIDGIKIDKKGAIKEFPDLKDNKEWKEETIKRFKEKIKNMKTENERMKYIIKDLTKYGYQPLYFQKKGDRPVKLY